MSAMPTSAVSGAVPAAGTAAQATSMPPRVPLWLLALFTFSGTLAMHIFVPALALASADLRASSSAMQMTVSLYILGLALGQLVYGPLADRFGRRPILMVGLSIYTVAGVVAMVAPDAYSLIAARLFQALGGCAGLVLGRAIVRDTALPAQAAKRLALMNLMVTLGPGAAPILGALLAGNLGWRSIFVVLTLLGVVNLVLAWKMLPETGTANMNVSAATFVRHYKHLLRSPAFLGFAVGGGAATTSMYAFIASAPFIFSGQMHRPPGEVGLYLAILVSGVWVGSMLTGWLIARVPLNRLMVGANLFSVLGAAIFLVVVLSDRMTPVWVIAPMFLFTVGAGVASPAALTQAVSVDPLVIGSASGLYGFVQMAVGALCTAVVGFGSSPALSAALVLVGASIVAQAAFWVALRQPTLNRH